MIDLIHCFYQETALSLYRHSCHNCTEISHFFLLFIIIIIPANEVPDSGMSKKTFCVILRSVLFNISSLLICKYAAIILIPQVTLYLMYNVK